MKKKMALQKTLKLQPHQEEGVQKFVNSGGKQLFTWGLGSGKTIGSIAALERINSKNNLILTPASLQKNYSDTVKKFVTPDSQKNYHIMSYEKFRRNPDQFIDEIKPESIVVDELHKQENPNSVSYKALWRARPKVKNFLGLTGTPIMNNPAEIYPLANLVENKSNHIPSKNEFLKNYTKIQKVYPKGLSGLYARLTDRYGEKRTLIHGQDLKKEFSGIIDKNVPTPEFMSHFPQENVHDIEVPMMHDQQKKYNYFMHKDLGMIDRYRIKHDLPPKARDAQNFFARLTHAREISNTPSVLSQKKIDPIASSGKLTVAYKNLSDHLKANPLNKAMVYSNFTESGLRPYEEALKRDNIPFGVFSGKVTRKAKNQDLIDYNQGKKRVLLVSPSGAEGIDLKGTTLQQNLDKSWNPAKNNQVTGRAVRYNSHVDLPPEMRNVRIENYYSTMKPKLIKRLFGKKNDSTIDQYIAHRAKEKQELNDQFDKLF